MVSIDIIYHDQVIGTWDTDDRIRSKILCPHCGTRMHTYTNQKENIDRKLPVWMEIDPKLVCKNCGHTQTLSEHLAYCYSEKELYKIMFSEC